MRPTVVLMVKVPRPGRVKTRLGAEIGMTTAAWWFRHQTRRLLREIRDPRWRIVLAVSPDREGMISRVWPESLPRIRQGPGDLGARMLRVMKRLGPGPVVVIGADVPAIRRQHIDRALGRLGGSDVVIGPAPDGGYWLIGVRRPSLLKRGALSGVRWSGPHARADTEKGLARLRISRADTLSDVDTLNDLRAAQSA